MLGSPCLSSLVPRLRLAGVGLSVRYREPLEFVALFAVAGLILAASQLLGPGSRVVLSSLIAVWAAWNIRSGASAARWSERKTKAWRRTRSVQALLNPSGRSRRKAPSPLRGTGA